MQRAVFDEQSDSKKPMHLSRRQREDERADTDDCIESWTIQSSLDPTLGNRNHYQRRNSRADGAYPIGPVFVHPRGLRGESDAPLRPSAGLQQPKQPRQIEHKLAMAFSEIHSKLCDERIS